MNTDPLITVKDADGTTRQVPLSTLATQKAAAPVVPTPSTPSTPAVAAQVPQPKPIIPLATQKAADTSEIVVPKASSQPAKVDHLQQVDNIVSAIRDIKKEKESVVKTPAPNDTPTIPKEHLKKEQSRIAALGTLLSLGDKEPAKKEVTPASPKTNPTLPDKSTKTFEPKIQKEQPTTSEPKEAAVPAKTLENDAVKESKITNTTTTDTNNQAAIQAKALTTVQKFTQDASSKTESTSNTSNDTPVLPKEITPKTPANTAASTTEKSISAENVDQKENPDDLPVDAEHTLTVPGETALSTTTPNIGVHEHAWDATDHNSLLEEELTSKDALLAHEAKPNPIAEMHVRKEQDVVKTSTIPLAAPMMPILSATKKVPVQDISKKDMATTVGAHAAPMGPIEELAAMTLDDFRRMAGRDTVGMSVLLEQFKLLLKESTLLYIDAVKVWQQSPLYQQYLGVLSLAVSSGMTVESALAAESGITKKEFDALVQLQSELRM